MSSASAQPLERMVEEILRPQRRVLAALLRSTALNRGDVENALQQLTEVSADILDVDRASVWKFNVDRDQLHCLNLFERPVSRHTQGAVLSSQASPRYFAALNEERSIAAADAQSDPRTAEFTQDYLRPHGIGAMLDAPVFLRGQLVGVVCHEHVGPPRQWELWEELVAGSFADFVAMVLGAAEQTSQAIQLERYRHHLEQLVDERTAQLKQSEESFRSLFQASPVALVLSQLDDQSVLGANARAAEMFGVSTEDAEKRRAPDFWVDPADRLELIRRIREQGSVPRLEAHLKRADGTRFWGDISAQSVQRPEGPALLVGVRDITAQRHAEHALRQSRETLHTLLDTAPVPMVLTRLKDAVLLFCNQPAAAMFETTVDAVLGRRAPDFYEDPADRRRFIETLHANGRVDQFTVRLRTLRGRSFWAIMTAKTLVIEGEDVFMVGFQDLTEQKKVEEQLRLLATVDSLTGAWNRRHFLELAEEEVRRADRYARPLSLAILDADHFKRINDTYGHHVGDEALRLLAHTIRRQLRSCDVLARFGGEELVVMLPETPLDASRAVMERVRQSIEAAELMHEGQRVPLTMSIGVASRVGSEDVGGILKRADGALYAAKNQGRNRVVTAS